ncbi:MAG: GNAT family N-acetyltransferase [Saprospiraceae bacterium]|nr:GNAT family N-acetyltransferase [Saprospiraceae bacterium]
MYITSAAPPDVYALADLMNRAFRGEEARQGWTHESDLLHGGVRTEPSILLELLETPGVSLLKYVDEAGTIQGCVCLQIKPRGLYLGMLTVDPKLQGGGIGKKLLAAAEAHARAHNCPNIHMSVISDRSELIDWYIRHGYSDTGERLPFNPEPKFGKPSKPLTFTILEKPMVAD